MAARPSPPDPAVAPSESAPLDPSQDRFTSRIFVGEVMHLRLKPVRHLFRHRMIALWLDIDRLRETARRRRFFGYNTFNLFGFYDKDHGPRDGSPLRPWVEARLAEAGAERPTRIMALCFPRVLGHEFNPLTVYYCYDASERLSGLVYEVKNTIDGQHAYPVRLDPAEESHRHSRQKDFYVSPFIGMDKTYRFLARDTAQKLSLRINESDAEGEELIATWTGRPEPMSDARIFRRALSHPLMSVKVVSLIHWHALRLVLKGAPVLGRKIATPVQQRGASSVQ